MKNTLRALTLGLATMLAGTAAFAAYPDKPITMIVGYSAGGATDLTARAVVPYLEKSLGAKIVVMNRAGAGGEIAFAALAAAPADGYTVGFINSPNVVSIPIERPGPFHWEKLDLLGNLIDDPGGFTVHPDSPYKTLADVVAAARAKPGTISVGTTGTGSDDHLAMLMLERQAGVKFNHIPFKGGADVRQAISGKQIDVASMNIGEAIAGSKSGQPFRNLGQMSLVRADIGPDVPTFKELGYDIQMAALRGIAAPKGLPPEIREKWVKAIADAMKEPAFVERARVQFTPVRYLGPKEYADELRGAEKLYREMWKVTPWSEK